MSRTPFKYSNKTNTSKPNTLIEQSLSSEWVTSKPNTLIEQSLSSEWVNTRGPEALLHMPKLPYIGKV